MKIFIRILFLALAVGACGLSLQSADSLQRQVARQEAAERARQGARRQAQLVRLAAYQRLAQSGEKKWLALPFSKVNAVGAQYGPLLALVDSEDEQQAVINDISIDLSALEGKESNFAVRLRARLTMLQNILKRLFSREPMAIAGGAVAPSFTDYEQENLGWSDWLPRLSYYNVPKQVRYRYLHSLEYRELQTIKTKYAPLMRLLVVEVENNPVSRIENNELEVDINRDIRALEAIKSSWAWNTVGLRTSSIEALVQRLNNLLALIEQRRQADFDTRVARGVRQGQRQHQEQGQTATGGTASGGAANVQVIFTGGGVPGAGVGPAGGPLPGLPPAAEPLAVPTVPAAVPGAGVGGPGGGLERSSQGGIESSGYGLEQSGISGGVGLQGSE